MSDISFEKAKDGYVAELVAPGNILMQIYSEKQGRLSIYQYMDGMPPVKIETCEFTNRIMQLNLLAGLKVRMESDVEVKACKYEQIPQTGGGGSCDCEPYVLPEASTSALGGIKLGFTQTGKKYPVATESGKAYVQVDWTDNNTTYDKATDSVLGLIKVGYSQNAKKYAVQLDGDGKAFVDVPWTDTNTTYSAANKSTLGLVKQAAFVADATGQEDAHTTINAIKAKLVEAGIMAAS